MSTLSQECIEISRRLRDDVLAPMKQIFYGKDECIDLLAIGLVAAENVFLFGPPGTAKSALVQYLGRRLDGVTFEYLLTRFTEPNELFGPFDIRRLREGELVTNTEGMLPEASLVFLDELLNANSAVLNSLLGVLNERVFRRGRETRRLPLMMTVGASNRLPDDEALMALFDRFLLRVRCDYVDTAELESVLDYGWQLEIAEKQQQSTQRLTLAEVRLLHEALPRVDLISVRPLLVQLITRMRAAGIVVSDRRAVKIQRLIAASALLCGRGHAEQSDLWITRYIWDRDEQREILNELVRTQLDQIEVTATEHPLARSQDLPDAEALLRDLQAIDRELKTENSTGRAALFDKLAILRGRIEWVGNESQRTALRQESQRLASQLQSAVTGVSG